VRPFILVRLLALALVAAVVATGVSLAAGEEPDRAPAPRTAATTPVERPIVKRSRERKRPQPIGLRAARLARRWLGVGYSWGGSSPATGFDCSGFTSYVYRRLGVELPHNAAAQFGTGQPVNRSRLRPGDLLFFRGLGHVGIYVGRGRMIHSPQSGDVVRIVRLGVDYGGELIGVRRITRALTTHN
jgi:cell wall-associated NlpC family hydrolase